MRDEGFRRAMNTVSPTAEQKARMRQALERKLPQRQARRYVGRQTRQRPFGWVPAAAALAAVAVGVGLALARGLHPQKPDAALVEPVQNTTQSVETQSVETQSVETQSGEVQTGAEWEELYASALGQYKEVFLGGNGGWSREEAIGIQERGEAHFGYTFWDLDGDGSAEMLMTDGKGVYGLYTLVDGKAEQVLKDNGVSRLYMHRDGTMVSRSEDALLAYRWEAGQLETVENVRRQSDPSAPYVRVGAQGTTAISQEEFDRVWSYEEDISLDFRSMSQWEGFEAYRQERLRGLDAPTPYGEVIEKYRTAIRLGWDQGRCMEEELSLLTVYAASEAEVGWALQDLDGDGSRELLILDGDNVIYGLYTLEGEKVKTVVTSGERVKYTLCEDNILLCRGANSAAASVYAFSRMEKGDLLTVESLMEDYSPENTADPWFRLSAGTDDSATPITEEEFNSAIRQHPQERVVREELAAWKG